MREATRAFQDTFTVDLLSCSVPLETPPSGTPATMSSLFTRSCHQVATDSEPVGSNGNALPSDEEYPPCSENACFRNSREVGRPTREISGSNGVIDRFTESAVLEFHLCVAGTR